MGIFLQAFWKIYEPIGAVAAPLLLFALGGLWIADHWQIGDLKGQVTDLHCQIDGPTNIPPCKIDGYRVLLSNKGRDLSIEKDNVKRLMVTIADLSAQADRWKADGDAAHARELKALQNGAAAAARAQLVAKQLQALKPQQIGSGSFADLVGLIQRKTP